MHKIILSCLLICPWTIASLAEPTNTSNDSSWFLSGGYGSEFGVVGASARWQHPIAENHYLTPSVGAGINIWSVILGPTSAPIAGSLGLQHSYGNTHRLAQAVFIGYIWLNYDRVNDVRENVRSTPGVAYRLAYEYYFSENEFIAMGPEVKYLWEKSFGDKFIFGWHIAGGIRF